MKRLAYILTVFAAFLLVAADKKKTTEQTPETNAPFKSTVEIDLDKDEWNQGELISGKVKFRLELVEQSNVKRIKTVRLNGPGMYVVFVRSPLPRKFYSVDFSERIPKQVEIGKTYEMRFSIKFSPKIQQMLATSKKIFPLFRQGEHRVRFEVLSSQTWDSLRIPNVFYGNYISEWVKFRIKAPTKKVFSKKDLLQKISNADPEFKGFLAEYYVHQKYPLGELAPLFEKTTGSLVIEGKSPPIFLLLAEPGQKINVRFNLESEKTHNFHVRDYINIALPRGQGESTFRIRNKECIHRVVDDSNNKIWGWILVKK